MCKYRKSKTELKRKNIKIKQELEKKKEPAD